MILLIYFSRGHKKRFFNPKNTFRPRESIRTRSSTVRSTRNRRKTPRMTNRRKTPRMTRILWTSKTDRKFFKDEVKEVKMRRSASLARNMKLMRLKRTITKNKK